MTATPSLSNYPLQSTDKLCCGSTDHQGHINNVAFTTYLETGRIKTLFTSNSPLTASGCEFVIA